MLFQCLQKFFFLLVISCRYNHGNHVACSEGILDLLISDLAFALLGCGQIGIAVTIWTIIGKIKCYNYNHQKDRWKNESRKHIEFTDCGNLRNKIFVLCFINQFTEQHKKSGHQGEHGQKA